MIRLPRLALVLILLSAADSLHALQSPSTVDELIGQLRKGSEKARVKAVIALAGQGQKASRAIPDLLLLASQADKSGKLHPEIFRAVERIGFDHSHLPKLMEEMRDRKSYSSSVLVGIVGEPAIPALLKVLDEEGDQDFRRAAARTLFNIRDIPLTRAPKLLTYLDDRDPFIQGQIAAVLGKMKASDKEVVSALTRAVERKVVLAAHGLSQLGSAAKDALPALRTALSDPDASIPVSTRYSSDVGKSEQRKAYLAEYAAIAIGEIGDNSEPVVKDLLAATRHSKLEVRAAAASALGQLRAASAMKELLEILAKTTNNADQPFRGAAARALARIGKPAVPHLFKAVDDKNPYLRRGALVALGLMSPPPDQALERVLKGIKDEDFNVRVAAISVFGVIDTRPEGTIPEIVGLFSSKFQTERVRETASNTLAKIGEPALSSLVKLAKHADAEPRRWAAVTLGKMKEDAKEAVPVLRSLLADRDSAVRIAAVKSLGEFGESALPAAAELESLKAKDSNPVVRRVAGEALKNIRDE